MDWSTEDLAGSVSEIAAKDVETREGCAALAPGEAGRTPGAIPADPHRVLLLGPRRVQSPPPTPVHHGDSSFHRADSRIERPGSTRNGPHGNGFVAAWYS